MNSYESIKTMNDNLKRSWEKVLSGEITHEAYNIMSKDVKKRIKEIRQEVKNDK